MIPTYGSLPNNHTMHCLTDVILIVVEMVVRVDGADGKTEFGALHLGAVVLPQHHLPQGGGVRKGEGLAAIKVIPNEL